MLKKLKSKLEKHFKEKKQNYRNLKNIDRKIKENLSIQYFNHLALNSTKSITTPKISQTHELILSFTTYNKRIHDVHLVLESIAQQTVKPNKVILWLDKDEFSIENIPVTLRNYINRGLDIQFCENYRSYKKIIPTLIKYPDANIITIDDDIMYPHDMIEQLVTGHRNNPNVIIGHRGHKISYQDDLVMPYKYWDKNHHQDEPSHDILLTGCGGILYPAHSLCNDVTDINIFMSLCPNADDIWLKVMAFKNNKKIKVINSGQNYDSRFISINLSQDIGLNKSNVDHNHNDIQLKKAMEHYEINFKRIN